MLTYLLEPNLVQASEQGFCLSLVTTTEDSMTNSILSYDNCISRLSKLEAFVDSYGLDFLDQDSQIGY